MPAECAGSGSRGMDWACRNLYFSVMRSGQSSSRGEASSRPPSVPAFYLYGESLQPPDERLIHIETIAARSQLHDWVIRPHRHRDLHQILMTKRGRVEETLDGRTETMTSPVAIVVPAGVIHAFRFQAGTDGLVISYAPPLARELAAPSDGLLAVLERAG